MTVLGKANTVRHRKNRSAKGQTAKSAQKSSLLLPPANQTLSLQQALVDPSAASPQAILALNQMAGNQALSRFIQTSRLTGPALNPYEVETDWLPAPDSQPDSLTALADNNRAVSLIQRHKPLDEEEKAKASLQRHKVHEGEEPKAKGIIQRHKPVDEEEEKGKGVAQRQSVTAPIVQRKDKAQKELDKLQASLPAAATGPEMVQLTTLGRSNSDLIKIAKLRQMTTVAEVIQVAALPNATADILKLAKLRHAATAADIVQLAGLAKTVSEIDKLAKLKHVTTTADIVQVAALTNAITDLAKLAKLRQVTGVADLIQWAALPNPNADIIQLAKLSQVTTPADIGQLTGLSRTIPELLKLGKLKQATNVADIIQLAGLPESLSEILNLAKLSIATSAAELAQLAGLSKTAAEIGKLAKLKQVTTTADVVQLAGLPKTLAEITKLSKLSQVTTVAELVQLAGTPKTVAEIGQLAKIRPGVTFAELLALANSPRSASEVTTLAKAAPGTPLEAIGPIAKPTISVNRLVPAPPGGNGFSILDPGDYGVTDTETVDVTLTAHQAGGNWHAAVTDMVGNYSKIIQSPPGGGRTEVTGPGGNTTPANYFQQARQLDRLGGPSWYMASAVDAHESVHEVRLLPALQDIEVQVQALFSALSVPVAGAADAATAVTQIKALPGYAAAVARLRPLWDARYVARITGDHNILTDIAEHTVVDPMVRSINAWAVAQAPPLPTYP
jgi:hypothetical protein